MQYYMPKPEKDPNKWSEILISLLLLALIIYILIKLTLK